MNDTLGELFREKLQQGMEAETGFMSANRSFYENVCTFISAQELPAPNFGLWADVRGMALGGSVIDAIKLLRDETTTTDFTPKEVPSHFKGSERAFAHFAIQICGSIKHIRRLSLVDAKNIIDLLRFDETYFDDIETS